MSGSLWSVVVAHERRRQDPKQLVTAKQKLHYATVLRIRQTGTHHGVYVHPMTPPSPRAPVLATRVVILFVDFALS